MPGPPDRAARPWRWFTMARENLALAAVEREDLPGAARAACFWAQQGLGASLLDELTQWAFHGRYPDLPEVHDPEPERLVGHARAVLRAAELALTRILGPEPEEG